MARALYLTRLVTLVLVLIFSIILLGLSAHSESELGQSSIFGGSVIGMPLAISVITIITVLPMVLIDFFRSGPFTSFILVEIVWFSILWVLWLATGGLISSNGMTTLFNTGCDLFFGSELDPETALNDVCHLWGALQAFSFLNFLLLFIYSVTLIVFGYIGSNRSEHVWTNSVREFGTGGAASASKQSYPMTETAPA
jgi:hypothetical protein